MKRLLLFICTLLCANVIMAQCFWDEGIQYEVTGAGKVRVVWADSWHITTANIPSSVTHTWEHYSYLDYCYITDSVRTYSVTSIGFEAFIYCDSLTSVTIPNSVTSIGDFAFFGCVNLTSVTIGNNVTSIGECAFSYCSLTSIDIPNSVTSIGYWAFYYCDSLTSVTIPNSVTSIREETFSRCSSLTSVTIPNSVTSIGHEAFSHCSSLTSVTIPNSVTSIGGGVFYNCSSLTSVTLSNNITELPCHYVNSYSHGFFEDCSSLTSVTIGNSVTSIGYDAFTGCSSLTTLNFNAINCNDFDYYDQPFENCPITTINIGDSVQRIPAYFVYNLNSLTSVTIPNSVTSIGISAFSGCSSLTSVTCLSTNPPALGYDAFDYIGSPSTLYVPNGCRQAYENSSWLDYFDCIVELGSNNSIAELDVEVNNEEWGSVEVNEGCGTATLTAVAEMDCSEFLHWSDGDTNNPRVVNVASDTSFTAIFKDPVLDTIIDVIITQGETYNFNGQELSEEGVYNATVFSVAGCEINLTVILYVISNDYTNGETSSLQETELEEIVFYPNPTKGLISFSKTIERIEVVDISGKILLSFSNVREINIGDLPAGSYLLRLHSNENSVLRKIVKE